MALLVLFCAVPLMAIGHYSGLKRKEVGLAAWVIVPGLALMNRLWRVRVRCNQPEKLRNHQGLILANHQSFLDIPVFHTIAPTRFLSAIEVLDRPIIGWIAKIVGCVFVERGSIRSAIAMREQIADALAAEPHPPFVMYPEGKLGGAEYLNKFRRGTFRIATENEVPYLLCALRYSRPDVTTWHGGRGESMLAAIVRLFRYGKPIIAEVMVLELITPTRTDSPQQLAVQAREIIGRSLGLEID